MNWPSAVGARGREARHDLERLARRRVRETVELAELADVAALVAVLRVVRDPRPPVARPEAKQVDAPGLIALRAWESELAERDRELDDVAVGRDAACRVPDRVPGRVLGAIHVVLNRVHLHAEWIHEELERAALVVEGVDHDADEVVVPSGVGVAQIGANRPRLRVARVERDEQLIAVLHEVDLRRDLRGLVLARIGFEREIDDERMGPNLVVEHAVDLGAALGVRDRAPERGRRALRFVGVRG